MSAQCIKVVNHLKSQIIDLYHLSNLDKAFERLIFKYVYNHFLENNILIFFSLDLEGETLLLINYLIYITLSVKL